MCVLFMQGMEINETIKRFHLHHLEIGIFWAEYGNERKSPRNFWLIFYEVCFSIYSRYFATSLIYMSARVLFLVCGIFQRNAA